MAKPDFHGAEQYALGRLERELPESLSYHSISHTRDDVAQAAERLARMEGLDEETILLLRTAAIFHDVGYIEHPEDHERASILTAGEILPRFGYSPEQIKRIQAMIQATKLPQTPHNREEEVLADADLDTLGREDFFTLSLHLRNELAARGQQFDEAHWYARQLDFLSSHHYWTVSAHKLRDAGKEKNIAELKRLLKQYQAEA
jgi:uncharacterized protein